MSVEACVQKCPSSVLTLGDLRSGTSPLGEFHKVTHKNERQNGPTKHVPVQGDEGRYLCEPLDSSRRIMSALQGGVLR